MKLTKLQVSIFGVLIAPLLSVGFADTAVAGHPASECKTYAQSAVDQFHALKAAGCQGKPGDTAWGDNYQGHYNFCLSTNADINHQSKERRLAIEKCAAHSDQQCHNYANDAVQQVNQFVKNGCLVKGGDPNLWGVNPQGHYNWCKANIGADLNHQHELRRLGIKNCQTGNGGNQGHGLSISASVILGSTGYVLQVGGSGFTSNGLVRVTYTWTQTNVDGTSQSGYTSFSGQAKPDQTYQQSVFANCQTGYRTTFTGIIATDVKGSKVSGPATAACPQ